MKLLQITAVLALSFLMSCGNTSSQEANAEGFGEIEKEIKSKFGDDAYYTDLTIVYNESVGNMINVIVTKDPESMKMEDWNLSQDVWKQNAEITLEVSEGAKAADFMFQLDDKINLSTLGGLVEKSMEQLKKEKDVDPALDMAFVKYPKDGDITKAEYTVKLKPKTGGTSFSFYYTLDGELIKMDY